MINQVNLGEKELKKIYLFKVVGDNKYAFFTTSSKDIVKTITQKKQSVKQSVLLEILQTNNYTYELLKEVPKDKVQNEVAQLERNLNLQSTPLSITTILEKQDKSIKLCLEYGTAQEEFLLGFFISYFAMELFRTKYQYALFDYYSLNCFTFELKSYKYPYNQYPTEIIGVRKALCENSIFIFQHNEENNTQSFYWIRYNQTLFDTFEITNIKTPNRITTEPCFRIEKQHLIKFDINDKIDIPLVPNKTEEEIVIDLIVKDQHKAKGIFYNHHTINNLITNQFS